MALTAAQIRSTVAAAVTGAGWRESPWAPELFPLDPTKEAHKAFAVHMPTTTFQGENESIRAKRGASGGLVVSAVTVRWAYRMRADAQVADYAAALTAEQEIVLALTNLSQAGGLHFRVGSMSRQTIGDGTYLLGEIVCTAIHQSPIQ